VPSSPACPFFGATVIGSSDQLARSAPLAFTLSPEQDQDQDQSLGLVISWINAAMKVSPTIAMMMPFIAVAS
jgi:hypothetical protein